MFQIKSIFSHAVFAAVFYFWTTVGRTREHYKLPMVIQVGVEQEIEFNIMTEIGCSSV